MITRITLALIAVFSVWSLHAAPPPKPAGPNDTTPEGLASRLSQLRRQKTEIEEKELALLGQLTQKLAGQAERFKKLNVAAPLYFPTRIGAKRVYSVSGGPAEKTDVVNMVERLSDGSLRVSVDVPDKPNSRRTIRVSRETLEVLDGPAKESGEVMLKPAAGTVDWFPFGADGGQLFRQSETEEVEVPAGKFRALRVDFGQSVEGVFKIAGSIWYAPGIGTVRQVNGGKESLALTSFTQGE